MRLVTLVFAIILNLSSATLYNVMVVVGDEAEEIGTIDKSEYRRIEILSQDSIRVIFTLGQEREGWLGTEKMAIRDTIKISDNVETFEVEIDFVD